MSNKTFRSSEKRGTKLIKNKRNSVYTEGVYTDKNGLMISIGDFVSFTERKNKISGEVIEFHPNNLITVLYENAQNNLLTVDVNASIVSL